jgi:GT2 family glycosyltransferase
VHEDSSYAVIVVSHDHAETLPACLEAVTALDPPPDEIVVVDNASADGSADVVAARSTSNLRLIRESLNTGFAAAVNRSLAEVSTPWVLLLNPDCSPRPDLVAKMLAAAHRRPEVDSIGSITAKLIRSRRR